MHGAKRFNSLPPPPPATSAFAFQLTYLQRASIGRHLAYLNPPDRFAPFHDYPDRDVREDHSSRGGGGATASDTSCNTRDNNAGRNNSAGDDEIRRSCTRRTLFSTEPSGQTRISSCRERTRVRGSAIVSAPRCHPPTRHARSLERGRRAESNAS